nr:fad-linked oxidoreductase azal [Quercus suber]
MLFVSYVLAALLFAVHTSYAAMDLPSPAEIAADLTPLLSRDAKVVLPNDTQEWDTLIERASYPRINPSYLAVVEVCNEADIQHVVRYANSKNVPFLAISSGNSWTATANRLHHGIQISMRKMQSAVVNRDRNTATLGGGTKQNITVKTLAAVGKRAGHSLQQGQYGFAADNLVSARLIVGNGTAITVSDSEHPDLFWAIRGAGHNFGIVSSFEVKIHDIPSGEAGFWTLTVLEFDETVLESFFTTWNTLEETYRDTNGLLALNGAFQHNANNSSIISLSIAHEGFNPVAKTFISNFRSLKPLTFVQQNGIPWSEIHDRMGLGAAPVCVSNLNFFTTPASFPQWNVTNMRNAFDMYSNFTKLPQFAESFWLLESYGRGQAASFEDDAVSAEERENHLLTGLTLQWEGDDLDTRRKAEEFALEAKQAIQEGWNEKHTYVNYAVGYETVEEMYGRDQKHLHRLQETKSAWDPENQFGFYAPLIGERSTDAGRPSHEGRDYIY